jgi:hypothetical protein
VRLRSWMLGEDIYSGNAKKFILFSCSSERELLKLQEVVQIGVERDRCFLLKEPDYPGCQNN